MGYRGSTSGMFVHHGALISGRCGERGLLWLEETLKTVCIRGVRKKDAILQQH